MLLSKKFIRDFTLSLSGNGNYTVPELANSDSTLAVQADSGNLSISVIDAAAGTIQVTSGGGFGLYDFTAGQDTNWSDGGGRLNHPVSIEEAEQYQFAYDNLITQATVEDELNSGVLTGNKVVSLKGQDGTEQASFTIPLKEYALAAELDSMELVAEKVMVSAGKYNHWLKLQYVDGDGATVTLGSVNLTSQFKYFHKVEAGDRTGTNSKKVRVHFRDSSGATAGTILATDLVVLQVDGIDGDDNKLTQDENGKLAVWTDNLLPHPDDAANSILKTDANDDLVAYATDAISGDADNALTAGTDGKLFVPPQSGGTVEVDPNSALAITSDGKLTIDETKLGEKVVSYLPIELQAFEDRKFTAGSWVKIDDHLELFITSDLEKFNLKYVRDNPNYPSSANIDYDITARFGSNRKNRIQSVGIFGNTTGLLIGDGQYEQNYFWRGGDTFIFNNNVELQEKDDWMECFVKLQSGNKVKNYQFNVKVLKGGDGQTVNKFLIYNIDVSGQSLTNDKAAYNY
jgi:hypothetical protein